MRSGFDHLAVGVDRSAFLASLSGTIPAALSQRWSSVPERDELQIGGVWHTAGELDAITRTSAAKLAALGAKPGDRIVLCAQSPAAFLPVYLGAVRSGVIVVPANVAYREAELEHLVRDSDACL